MRLSFVALLLLLGAGSIAAYCFLPDEPLPDMITKLQPLYAVLLPAGGVRILDSEEEASRARGLFEVLYRLSGSDRFWSRPSHKGVSCRRCFRQDS